MTNLNPMDFSNDPLLSELQGNILKGHGREHTTHIFVKFKDGEQINVKKWIKNFGEKYVTSCKKQLRDRELYKRNKVDGGIFASILFTAKGYEYLFPGEVIKLNDASFLVGMKGRIAKNNDPLQGDWELGFQKEIHAMILIGDDNADKMSLFVKKILKAGEDVALDLNTICNKNDISTEYGHAIRNANNDGLEHFGYVDGISQPLFLKDEVDAYKSFHAITDENEMKFDPTADTDLVLLDDPYTQKPHAKGSYFVFRKLEQHVQEFKEAEESLGLDELGGAYIVGRFEDGTPTLKSDKDGMIGSGNFNNFDYENDPSGGRCPHFAHIRKVNPRREGTGFDDKSHIMARRGIPYGFRNVNTEIDPAIEQMPNGDVGLLFMSYQKSITKQFEFIQQKWANDRNFITKETGIDAIIGQSKNNADKVIDRHYHFPHEYGINHTLANADAHDFKPFVDMKGGEYFFAPSIDFLKNIQENEENKT